MNAIRSAARQAPGRTFANFLDTQVAAAVLISGNPGTAVQTKGCDLAKVALWAIHGDQDTVVDYQSDKLRVEQLIACPAPPRREVRFTTIEGGDHGIYADPYAGRTTFDIYAWLLANGKP